MKEIFGITVRAVDRLQVYEQKYSGSCGPASLVIAYRALGKDIPEDQLMQEMRTTEDGTEWGAMLNNPYLHGFNVWHGSNAHYEDIEALVKTTGFPIVVPWFSDRISPPDDHYSVIKWIDPSGITLVDPEMGDLYTLRKTEFVSKWYQNGNNSEYMVISTQI